MSPRNLIIQSILILLLCSKYYFALQNNGPIFKQKKLYSQPSSKSFLLCSFIIYFNLYIIERNENKSNEEEEKEKASEEEGKEDKEDKGKEEKKGQEDKDKETREGESKETKKGESKETKEGESKKTKEGESKETKDKSKESKKQSKEGTKESKPQKSEGEKDKNTKEEKKDEGKAKKDDDSKSSKKKGEGLSESDIRSIMKEESEQNQQESNNKHEAVMKRIDQVEQNINKKMQENSDKLEMNENNNLKSQVSGIIQGISKQMSTSSIATQLMLEEAVERSQKKLEKATLQLQRLREQLPTEQNDCFSHKSCQSCIKATECGWCILEQTCVTGDNVSPYSSACAMYSYHYCASADCGRYTDCHSCMNDINCGWCKDPFQLFEGCVDGDQDNTECPDWFHIKAIKNNQCPSKESDGGDDSIKQQSECAKKIKRDRMSKIQNIDKTNIMNMKITNQQDLVRSLKIQIQQKEQEVSSLQTQVENYQDKLELLTAPPQKK